MRRIRIIGRRKGRTAHRYAKTQEFKRFALSGFVSQLVYYSIYIGTVELFALHYLLAATVAFFFYWVVNFYLIKYWTFQSKAKASREARKYFAVHACNQLFRLVGLYVLKDMMGNGYIFAQLLMSVVYFCINLLFARKIFNEGDF